MPPRGDIDTAVTGPQSLQHDLIEKCGKARRVEADFMSGGILSDAQRGLQQGEERSRSPSLWRTGDWIKRRASSGRAREAAQQFGQTVQFQVGGGVEHGAEDSDRLVLGVIATEPGSDHRIVVRPDRAVVVGHWIIAGRAARHCPDAPSGKGAWLHQPGDDLAGAIPLGNAAEQNLAGIRRMNAAGLLVTVERQRVGAEVLAPERRLEALGKPTCLLLELAGAFGKAELQRAPSCELLRQIDVTLDFG